MKYKVYYKDDICKVFNKGSLCILNMLKTIPPQRCPVETGGSFNLANGDVLYINEEYGGLDPWGSGEPEYSGIGLSLDSGNDFIAYLLIPSNIGGGIQAQETGYGCFYDLNNLEYEEGNIIKIYDLGVEDLYDVSPFPDEMFWQESRYLGYGLSLSAVIILNDGNWELSTEPYYVGQTLTLASGEEVYVSGPSMEDGIGIFFTLSSGRENTSYYYSNGNEIHSSHGYFSPIMPEENDEIHIYVYEDGDSYESWGWDTDWSDENVISELATHLCSLKFVNGRWTILEDNSND